MMDHKSIRAYTNEDPSDEVIESIVRTAQQALFYTGDYAIKDHDDYL